MKLMGDIVRWAGAVVSAWYGWVGASATVGLVGFGQSMNWWESPGKRFYIVLLIVGFVISVFGGWRKQYRVAEEAKAKVYDGRPIIVLEVNAQPSIAKLDGPPESKYDAPEFGLHNGGQRTARFVTIKPFESTLGNYHIRFQTVVSLEPGQHRYINFAVDDSPTETDKGELAWRFLHDNPDGSVFVWYDTTIDFRDAGESAMQDTVRLAFEIASSHLYPTAVPYTQRPPQKPEKLKLPRSSWLGRRFG